MNKTKEKGKQKLSLTPLLFLLFSFPLIFLITYLILYGPTFPVEIRWKGTDTSDQYVDNTRALSDSVAILDSILADLKLMIKDKQQQLSEGQRELRELEKRKRAIEEEVARKTAELESLNLAIGEAKLKRAKRMAAILSSMPSEEIDSLLIELDDDAIVEILAQARERQAATILSAINPKRAAKIAKKMAE